MYVIGAGPGGLAVAAVLGRRGVPATVLERGDAVGTSWRSHYDRLRLHTIRRWSGQPGLAIPRSSGRWVARDDLVRYLEQYAAHHDLDLRTGTEVCRVDLGQDTDPAGTRWTLSTVGGDELPAGTVVIATGYNHTPYVPPWQGRETFTGELLHAKDYRNPTPYAGRDVLVVGTGNTGAEIAVDLVEGGAGRVRLAVRTPPHIVRRDVAGWPSQGSGILLRRLPPAIVDKLSARVASRTVPDLGEYGLPRPQIGLYTRLLRDRTAPVQDAGLIDAVLSRRVEPVAAVAGFDGAEVRLADGSVVTPEVVIAATGYRRGLEKMVGHLDVLDERGVPRVHGGVASAPGLFFAGYRISLGGSLREAGIEARRIARAVRRNAKRSPDPVR
ncbi:flavin-containing monooxygenase [Plantactinospora endophytica]|uniref:Monooxygenase n=1 Tax=Plantactinospora endophytica TaxID=673535 RepID=A0ABQ4E482_9ACTN|nr:NAD(P)/FAD-dependent oxidoreductase [Plantactinospora endophytica]GIG89132.1 monooxygenase [Plantactinospora endophytica]